MYSGQAIRQVSFLAAFWLSLAFCIGSAAMVMRSWWVRDMWRWTTSDLNDAHLELWHGTFKFTRENWPHEFDTRGHPESLLQRQIQHPPGLRAHVSDHGDRGYTLYTSAVNFRNVRFPDRVYWSGLGVQVFEVASEKPQADGLFNHATYVVGPFWPFVPIGLIVPLWRFIRWRRFRANPGHCPRCRYDLRATPDHCRECGWRVDVE
jgi:hypothetical protein